MKKYRMMIVALLAALLAGCAIDNMDEPPTVDEEDLMNTISGKTKILITTRADIPISKKYNLDYLDSEAALVLFYRHYKRSRKRSLNSC